MTTCARSENGQESPRSRLYEALAAYVQGMDSGSSGALLVGWYEFPHLRYGELSNLAWISLVEQLAFPGGIPSLKTEADEEVAIAALFDLLDEFLCRGSWPLEPKAPVPRVLRLGNSAARLRRGLDPLHVVATSRAHDDRCRRRRPGTDEIRRLRSHRQRDSPLRPLGRRGACPGQRSGDTPRFGNTERSMNCCLSQPAVTIHRRSDHDDVRRICRRRARR